MYGLPADFDASPFVGRELSQVWFQKYSMQFVFGEDPGDEIKVILNSAFVYQRGLDVAPTKRDVPVMASNVTELVGRRVTQAEGTKSGTLTLSFEGGAMLQFLDSSKKYESYQIIGFGSPVPVMKGDQPAGFEYRVIV